jgi:hypothetical protein
MRRYILIALMLIAVPRSWAQYSGGTGTANDPYLIRTAREMADLAASPHDWNRHFLQTADIDLSVLASGETCLIGNEDIPFSGTFDGGSRTITRLAITNPGANGAGLFGQVRGYTAAIRNVVLVDPNVHAPDTEYVGALVGRVRSGAVTQCRVVRARVTGHMGVGGLIGWNQGAIEGCAVTGDVVGVYSVGGLTGVTFWCDDIRNCRADVTVAGHKRVGGLVGNCALAAIRWCSASGHVEGHSDVGGLVGCNEGGELSNSYAVGPVIGTEAVGGLLGRNALSCDCSAGALPGEVSHCYAIGPVRGTAQAGGLVGRNEACLVARCFWDTETSGLTHSGGGTGLATAALQSLQTFIDAHWDFAPKTSSQDYWVLCGTGAYPRPAWQIVPGDWDTDGDVDWCDFSLLARRWSRPRSICWQTADDRRSHGRADFGDLETLGRHWLVGRYP